jgi:hypothetical protein
MNKKKTAKFGNVGISAKDFQDKNVRIQISMKVPMDLLKAYRTLAEEQGKGYQTLMQEVLRGALATEKPHSERKRNIRQGWKVGNIDENTLKRLEKIEAKMHFFEEEIPKLKRAY